MLNDKPEDTIRDRNLKATIWRNEGEKSPYHTTSFARTYEDERGELQDSHSFNSGELLRVSELARQAHHRVNELRREEFKEKRREEQDQERPRSRKR